MIYDELTIEHDQRKIPIIQLGREDALKIFQEWRNKGDKTLY